VNFSHNPHESGHIIFPTDELQSTVPHLDAYIALSLQITPNPTLTSASIITPFIILIHFSQNISQKILNPKQLSKFSTVFIQSSIPRGEFRDVSIAELVEVENQNTSYLSKS